MEGERREKRSTRGGKDGRMSRSCIADGKIDKLADAWHLLDLPDCGSDCGDNQARPTVIDSRSILAGVQGFGLSYSAMHSDFLILLPHRIIDISQMLLGCGRNGKDCS